MKPIKITIFAFCCFAFFGCGNGNDDNPSGAFEATEIIVSSQANGEILQLNITEGEKLSTGEIVGKIDSTQLYLKKQQLLESGKGVRVQRPNIARQTAAIEQQIAKLRRERTRTENLIAANAANKKQLDDINAEIGILQRQLSAQKSSLQKSSANISAQSSSIDIQIAQLDNQLQKTTIKSPISGTVLEKYAEIGELTMMGTPLFKVADLDNMILRAYIPNEQLTQLKINEKVNVRVDFGEDEMKTYEGKIIWISQKAEFTPKTIQTKSVRENLVYAIKISVKNDGYLKIGMYGEVAIN